MILIRNVFRLKFGKAKEAVALWKDGIALQRRLGFHTVPPRILTDLTGPYYTLVLELTHESFGDYERAARELMSNSEWRSWYERIVPLTESGHREIFNIVE
jgi:hypothetical protein